jgi:hypothetical protein
MGGGMGGGVSEGEGKGGVRVYETYEVKNKRGKIRCLLLRRKKIFYLHLSCDYFTGKKKNAPLFTTSDWVSLPQSVIGKCTMTLCGRLTHR